MDDTQRLRIYRPDEDDPAMDALMCRRDVARPDMFARGPATTGADGANETPSATEALELNSEMPSGTAGILTQAGGLLRRFILFTGYSVTACFLTGCTALQPLHGIPVRQLPPEFRGSSRANMETIDLSRLSQVPQVHIVDSGDLLGVYVNGVLGKIDETPPVYIPQNGDGKPTIGLPIPVRDDGTISLPQVPPIYVRGMTERQVEEAVRKVYVERGIRADGTEILVSLQRARSYKVTVLRQETPNPAITGLAGGGIQLGATKRGTGQEVILPAGENDVLHALTKSGGLPGLDAQNAIYVLRRPRMIPQVPLTAMLDRRTSWTSPAPSVAPIVLTSHTTQQKDPFAFLSRIGKSRQGQITLVGHSLPATSFNEPQAPQQFMQIDADPAQVAPWNRPRLQPTPPARGNGGDGGFSTPVFNSPNRGLALRNKNEEPLPPPLPEPMAARKFETAKPVQNAAGPELAVPDRLPIVANENHHIPKELENHIATGGQVFRIPVRLGPGEEAHFNEEDILLYNGDIIFIESRDTEIFYTGGLLGGGQFSLPRDYDLDVIDAISIAQGRGTAGGGGANQIGGVASVNQDISVSASNLVVIRRLADGRRVNIKIDVNKALRDENENLLVQPGDHLILRYTPIEAVGAFIERNLLAGSLIGVATQASSLRSSK